MIVMLCCGQPPLTIALKIRCMASRTFTACSDEPDAVRDSMPGVTCMSLQDVGGVTGREGINGYGIMAKSGPEVRHDDTIFRSPSLFLDRGHLCTLVSPITSVQPLISKAWSTWGCLKPLCLCMSAAVCSDAQS